MNTTSGFTPSPMDLLMVIPRLAQRAGAFAFFHMPEQFDNFIGKVRNGGSVIAEPTIPETINITAKMTPSTFDQSATPPLASAAAAQQAATQATKNLFNFQNVRNLGGVFQYMTSKWALATFAAHILANRTHFYASSRVPLTLRWPMRLVLYIIPIFIFTYQTLWILQGLRCQTSLDWPELRYGNSETHLDIDFAGDGGYLYRLSSTILFWETDADACRNVNMGAVDGPVTELSGSLALLWPLFVSLCFSTFVDTLVNALQGRAFMPETGMTIFEHSLAFAEAEAMITRPFDFGGLAVKGVSADTITVSKGVEGSGKVLITKALMLQVMNVPSEVLLISLISSLSHLTGGILVVLGMKSKLRLIHSGIWGLAYMSTFAWSFWKFSFRDLDDGKDSAILRFPTVCIIGFIPHLLILIGIACCAMIYGLALVITAFALPGRFVGFKERLAAAYENLHANVHLSTNTPISFSWHDDFYTALLKTGFTILTSASEAVYLNEGSKVRVAQSTWLEEKRIQELFQQKTLLHRIINRIPAEIRNDAMALNIGLSEAPNRDNDGSFLHSGYAQERKTRKAQATTAKELELGILERRSRYVMTTEFLKALFSFIASLNAWIFIRLLQAMRITYRPRWLLRISGIDEQIRKGRPQSRGVKTHSREKYFTDRPVSPTQFQYSNDRNVDVEDITRDRIQTWFTEKEPPEKIEERVNDHLYEWWKGGGWWGDKDESGEYVDHMEDDDITSVITISSTAEREDEWSDIDEGVRTPTQEDPYPISREATPMTDDLMNTSHLANLLDPQTADQRSEAQILARHLKSEGIMTRSQYKRDLLRDRSRILLSRNGSTTVGGLLSAEDEERELEKFILDRRSATPRSSNDNKNGATWDTGAEGMGSGGPQCVVCQFSPRTVLVWPCGCLSLCDDCRVGLAARNFSSCVCCRSNVVAYSRLYVP
ncbi:hypothetical protein M501DRAFT_935169 [Patellaria atrata CBS 101060]|uniref:Ubiquitin-protein ligase n=1 Tax=Patellaria atrata CBS 101060 TaxID=1346257 RepID=A0A9P4VPC6_9PEZI|nr:hypothetical protein M501DRAFT_935169 [Patellaria atrata CBS 101060]